MAGLFVFVPHSILSDNSSGFLFGTVREYGDVVTVCCAMKWRHDAPSYKLDRKSWRVGNEKSLVSGFQQVGIVCYREASKDSQIDGGIKADSLWFELYISLEKLNIQAQNVYYKGECISSRQVSIVMLTASEFTNSQLLNTEIYWKRETNFEKTFVDLLIYTFYKVSALGKKVERCTNVSVPNELFRKRFFPETFVEIFYYAFFYGCIIYEVLCRNIFGLPRMLKKLFLQSALMQQVSQRGLLMRIPAREVIYEQDISILSWNILSALFFDLISGSIFMYILLDHCPYEQWFLQVLNLISHFVYWLDGLVQWLMGDPAGLKLNIPLNTIIGNIFLYHIYLWKTYITIIEPIFLLCLNVLPGFGILGTTFFLCAVNDLISLATIHIYCFYGYMARIYYYHVCALSCLWRLFRGKKWNPETQRVESYRFDVHQLYIGTLLFTVLIFLLPTVVVYYVVFATLRMAVLFIQGLISMLTKMLTAFPLYVIILRMLKNESIAGDLRFSTAHWNEVLVLSLEVIQLPLKSIIQMTSPKLAQFGEILCWRELMSYLFHGKIIYPI